MKHLILMCSILAACGPTTEENMGLNVNFEGVYRGPNRHSQVPPGAAERAENLISYNKGEAVVTEGMELLPGTYTTSPERFSSGTPYDNYTIERTSTGALYRRSSGGTLTAITTGISPPSGVFRAPYAEAGQNLYIATSAGVKAMDGGTSTPAAVGLPSPFAPYYSIPGAGSSAFQLAPGESVAYRAEIRRKDAEGNDIISVPSGRTVVTSTIVGVKATGTVTLAGTANNVTVTINGTAVGPIPGAGTDTATVVEIAQAINLTPALQGVVTVYANGAVLAITAVTPGTAGNSITLTAAATAGTATASGANLAGGSGALTEVLTKNYLPAGLQAGDEFRLYRTGTADDGVNPGDTMYLVHTAFLTSFEVSAKYHEWTDDTVDELRGEPLYTNGTQGGILRQNERPPLAKTLAAFDDYLLTGNVQGPQRFTLRMLALPSNGDVITIAGDDFTASNVSENPTAGIFSVYGTAPTVSQNIEDASKSLVLAINRKTGNTDTYAYYVSGENDPPGIIAIEGRDVTTAAFTVEASANGTRFEPAIDDPQSSAATVEPSGIWVSKRGEHYAFPPLRSANATYRFRVGTRERDILAMVPLREAVIVFTNGEGVFKVQRVGNELWRADQINGTTQLLVPGSVAVVDNRVLALTTRGLVAVDTGGVEEIDLPIKDAIKSILSLSSTVLTSYTFAVGDDARQRYTLYHPASNSDTYATHAWVYNGTTGTWTERTDPASGGFIDDDTGLLYLGSATSNTLTRERTGTAAQVYKRPDSTAIPVRLEWTVMDEGDPGASKQYTELRLLTKEAVSGNVTFNCTNDLDGTESTTAVGTSEPFIRGWVPDGCQWTSRLKVDIQRNVLGEAFTIVGMKTLLAVMEDGTLTR